ncbi:MAG: hypothetical protein RSA86_06330, partial [Christensenellaceae bacterium]
MRLKGTATISISRRLLLHSFKPLNSSFAAPKGVLVLQSTFWKAALHAICSLLALPLVDFVCILLFSLHFYLPKKIMSVSKTKTRILRKGFELVNLWCTRR